MIVSKNAIYQLATFIIILGFVMLIQPFTMEAFKWGLPVMIAGIVIYVILDHIPDKSKE